MKHLLLITALLSLSGCASYKVTESEVESYLNEKVSFDRSINLMGMAQASIKVDELDVGIGRISNNRVNVKTLSQASLEITGQGKQDFELDVNFSAVPYYNQDQGAIYLQSFQVEALDVKPPIINSRLFTPMINMIGEYLLSVPVYRLDEGDFKERAIKAANPELSIKDNSLVIDL